jgi:hypothetical protein
MERRGGWYGNYRVNLMKRKAPTILVFAEEKVGAILAV